MNAKSIKPVVYPWLFADTGRVSVYNTVYGFTTGKSALPGAKPRGAAKWQKLFVYTIFFFFILLYAIIKIIYVQS